jgi:hypothetical protein
MTTTPDPADAALEQALRDSRRLEDAPEHVIQRALAQWRPRGVPGAARSLLQQMLAALTFDSGAATPLAFGTRSAGGTLRQLLFSAQGRDIDLRVAPVDAAGGDPDAARWQLSGQVLGPDSAGTVVLADATGQVIGETALSDLGEFRLPAMPAGAYTLTLRFAETEVVLPPVRVPAE